MRFYNLCHYTQNTYYVNPPLREGARPLGHQKGVTKKTAFGCL